MNDTEKINIEISMENVELDNHSKIAVGFMALGQIVIVLWSIARTLCVWMVASSCEQHNVTITTDQNLSVTIQSVLCVCRLVCSYLASVGREAHHSVLQLWRLRTAAKPFGII